MTDARQAERVRSLLPAKLTFNSGTTVFDCLVKNISSDGARLQIDEHIGVPVEFQMSVPSRSATYQARVVWRGRDAMGVMFLNPPSREEVLALPQIKQLQHENAVLKARVRLLTQRLQELGQEVTD